MKTCNPTIIITLAVIDTLIAIKCGISETIQLIKSKAK